MIKAGYFMVKAFLKKLREDTVSAFAAQTAFFVILSFLPFLIFLLTLVRFLPVETEKLLASVQSVFPEAVHNYIGVLLYEVLQKTSGAIVSISVITALWSASRGFLVMIQGMNAVYGNKETRKYFTLRLLAVGYTLAFAMVLLLALVLLVFGNRIFIYAQNRVPLLRQAAFFVICLRTVISFFVLTGFFWGLYLLVPNRKSKHAAAELPGAILSGAGWLGFSYLYSFYIDRMSNFSAMYGSLTAIVLCMIWLYACMYIMFIGAELNEVAAEPGVKEAWRVFRGSIRRKGKKGIKRKKM